MSDKQSENSKFDKLLDLFLEALEERQVLRMNPEAVEPAQLSELQTDVEEQAIAAVDVVDAPIAEGDNVDSVDSAENDLASAVVTPDEEIVSDELFESNDGEPLESNDDMKSDEDYFEDVEEFEPIPVMSAEESAVIGQQLQRFIGRIAMAIALLLIVINIPFNRFGTSLARAMPDRTALVVRDGLVVKGEGDEIYVLEDNQLRWISSLDAFEWYNYRWDQVRIVDAEFLEQFEQGPPVHLVMKCSASPHIYAFEDGDKRWIKDPQTFEAEGFVWEEVQFVSCVYLRNLPDGIPFPADAGEPPQP